MSTSDPRRAYVLRVASHILSLNLVEEKLPNVQALHNFCDGTASIFVISRVDQKGHVDVSNELKPNSPALFRVILYKTKGSLPLSISDYKAEVNVLTAHKNVEESFASSLQQVFLNIFDERTNPKAKGLVEELTAELDAELDGRLSRREDDDSESRRGMKLESEFKYWQKRADLGTDTGGFSDIFQQLSEKLVFLRELTSTIDDLFDFLKVAEECMDLLWNSMELSYTEQRMTELIHAISARLCTLVQTRLAFFGERIWRDDAESGEALRSSLTLLSDWRDTVRHLTMENWPRSAANEWRGEAVQMNAAFNAFQAQIEKISSIRNFPIEVHGLSGSRDLRVEIFEIIHATFRDFNPLAASDSAKWARNVSAVERRFDEVVERLIPQLRARLQPAANSTFTAVAVLSITLK